MGKNREYQFRRCFRYLMILIIFVLAGIVTAYVYQPKEACAQGCVGVGINANPRRIWPAGARGWQCAGSEALCGYSYWPTDDIDNDDIWAWCCDILSVP